MRRFLPPVLLLSACQTAADHPGVVPQPRPLVPVVQRLAPGTAVVPAIAAGLPDEPLWRAAIVWWREALRQSAHLDVHDTEDGRPIAVLRLAIDPAARSLAAFCMLPDGRELALAGGSFADGSLAAGIDLVAWATRIALGDDGPAPVACAQCVSGNPQAILAMTDGQDLLRDGAMQGARRAFAAARVHDGGSPFVLDGLASTALIHGDPGLAERICREALGYEARLSPTTQHRLARTLLLARASQRPDDAAVHDRELQALGEACARERPFDPEGALSRAIAANFLGDFAAARPLLEPLLVRLPGQAIVPYHLGWACLALGDARAAAVHFETAALRLPMPWVVIPRALALHALGDDAGLAELLARAAQSPDAQAGSLPHDLQRMQAAQALLAGDTQQAAAAMLADFHWLLAHPSVLGNRAGELAEQGELLVRLGRAAALPAILTAFQRQHPGSAIADACAYLSGLVEVATTGKRAEPTEDLLARGGESAWSSRLQAFAHEQRGEVADMHAALARAARLTDTAMTKALLARSMQAMGRAAEAAALRQALRRELTTIHLRRRPMHPLLGPELAFAFRAD